MHTDSDTQGLTRQINRFVPSQIDLQIDRFISVYFPEKKKKERYKESQ